MFLIPSEVRHLRFSDFKENVILIHPETKTGAREIPLFGEIRDIVDRIQADLGKNYQTSDLVFAQLPTEKCIEPFPMFLDYNRIIVKQQRAASETERKRLLLTYSAYFCTLSLQDKP